MERAMKDQRILHELALIYIALAHSTDEKLDDAEISAIAERLRGWQDTNTQTVLSALKEALDDYVKEGADERVNQAIRKVRDAVPEDLRQFIVDDLVDIAMADGQFLYNESSFIGEVARAWGVHVSDGEIVRKNGWSILQNEGAETNWTPVHDLALVYLTLAHRTDEDLSTQEVDAIAKKLGEWIPDATEDEVLGLVQEALSVYVQGRDERMFIEAVESLKDAVPEHQREALLADLNYVAGADGKVLDEEKLLIERLSRAWRVQVAG